MNARNSLPKRTTPPKWCIDSRVHHFSELNRFDLEEWRVQSPAAGSNRVNEVETAKVRQQGPPRTAFGSMDSEFRNLPQPAKVRCHSTMNTDTENDASLFRRFRDRGDTDAFETLFKRHRDSLIAYLWTLTASKAVAEDISQYCWLRLLESDKDSGYTPRPDATIMTYLRTVGRNRYIDEYKRKHGESRTDAVDENDHRLGSSDSAYENAVSAQTQASIEAALQNLPIEQRDVIAMWLQGFSIKEMMGMTRAPRDTVISRKKYALKKLQAAFELAGVRISDVPV